MNIDMSRGRAAIGIAQWVLALASIPIFYEYGLIAAGAWAGFVFLAGSVLDRGIQTWSRRQADQGGGVDG